MAATPVTMRPVTMREESFNLNSMLSGNEIDAFYKDLAEKFAAAGFVAGCDEGKDEFPIKLSVVGYTSVRISWDAAQFPGLEAKLSGILSGTAQRQRPEAAAIVDMGKFTLEVKLMELKFLNETGTLYEIKRTEMSASLPYKIATIIGHFESENNHRGISAPQEAATFTVALAGLKSLKIGLPATDNQISAIQDITSASQNKRVSSVALKVLSQDDEFKALLDNNSTHRDAQRSHLKDWLGTDSEVLVDKVMDSLRSHALKQNPVKR